MMFGRDYLREYVIRDSSDIVALLANHAFMLQVIHGINVVIDAKALRALLRKWPYCPCRFKKSPNTMCPCIWHIEELRERGRCKCGLFRRVQISPRVLSFIT